VLSDLAIQAGGGTVMVRDGAAGLKELSAADLADTANKIAHALEARPPSPGEGGRGGGRGVGGEGSGRDILVLGGALDDPATRALLSWGTVAGAALLLEDDPENVLGTAVWARPTVFAGTLDEAARFRRAAERSGQGWLRRLSPTLGRRPGLPFGRLRALLLTEPGPLPQDDEEFWRRRGVAVRFLPQCGIDWYISRRGDRDA
jgi:hypothetical protein